MSLQGYSQSSLKGWGNQGKFLKDQKKGNVTATVKKEDLGNDRLVRLGSVPGNGMEQIILITVSKHYEK